MEYDSRMQLARVSLYLKVKVSMSGHLNNSMVQNISWRADNCHVVKKFPAFKETQMFITFCTIYLFAQLCSL